MTKKVLFICSGNICRSPMAAALAEKILQDARVDALVLSAGTLGINGSTAAPHAVTAMAEIGISIDGHRSRGISLELAKAAHHLVVMAEEHEEALLLRDSSLAPKIHRLWEYAEPSLGLTQIDDPVGQDLKTFIECRNTMERCIVKWAQRLRALS